MILISHRGNISGRNPERENTISYIQEAINQDFFVEIDVSFSFEKNKLMLRHDHDGRGSDIDWDFISKNRDKLLIHCKDISGLRFIKDSEYNYFYHGEDDFCLSSKQWIIAHSRMGVDYINKKDIILMLPEKHGLSKDAVKECAGICSDIISFYK